MADPKNLAYLDTLVSTGVITRDESESLLNNGLLPVAGLPHEEVRDLVALANRLATAREALKTARSL